jgi:hypothetical protein
MFTWIIHRSHNQAVLLIILNDSYIYRHCTIIDYKSMCLYLRCVEALYRKFRLPRIVSTIRCFFRYSVTDNYWQYQLLFFSPFSKFSHDFLQITLFSWTLFVRRKKNVVKQTNTITLVFIQVTQVFVLPINISCRFFPLRLALQWW